MFTSVKSVYSALGVMLFLVAMYLVLQHAGGATQIIASIASAGKMTFGTLQGR
jgi:hypothetical protein